MPRQNGNATKKCYSGKILLKPVLSQAMNQTRYSDRRFFSWKTRVSNWD